MGGEDWFSTKLIRIDPQDGAVLREFTIGAHLLGLAWDGAKLWAVGERDSTVQDFRLFRIDPNSGSVEATIDIPEKNYTGLEYQDGMIWVGEDGASQDRIWIIDPTTGVLVASYEAPSGWTHGIALGSSYLWVSDGAVPFRIFRCTAIGAPPSLP
jgi:glutamine cyclotransferase